MAEDGETLYEYNKRIGLTTTKQDRLDSMVGRPVEPDFLKEIRRRIDKAVEKRVRKIDQGII